MIYQAALILGFSAFAVFACGVLMSTLGVIILVARYLASGRYRWRRG